MNLRGCLPICCMVVIVSIGLSTSADEDNDETKNSTKNDNPELENETRIPLNVTSIAQNDTAALIDEFTAKLDEIAKESPHLEALVERVKARELEAKEELERQSFTLKYRKFKSEKGASETDLDVVMKFMDDYVMDLMGAKEKPNEPFIKLQDLISMVDMSDKLRTQIRELEKQLDEAKCGTECLGKAMGAIMEEAIGILMGGAMPNFDQFDEDLARESLDQRPDETGNEKSGTKAQDNVKTTINHEDL